MTKTPNSLILITAEVQSERGSTVNPKLDTLERVFLVALCVVGALGFFITIAVNRPKTPLEIETRAITVSTQDRNLRALKSLLQVNLDAWQPERPLTCVWTATLTQANASFGLAYILVESNGDACGKTGLVLKNNSTNAIAQVIADIKNSIEVRENIARFLSP